MSTPEVLEYSGNIVSVDVSFPLSNMPEINNVGILSSAGLDDLESFVANLPTDSNFGQGIITLSSHPLPGFLTPLGSGTHEIVGYVKDAQNNPIARRVFAVSRSSLLPLDSTLSDPISGSFRLQVPNEECVVICLPLESDGVNAEIFDRINPIDI